MKTKIKLYLLSWIIPAFAFAQDPVSWITSAKKIDDKTYELHFKADIQSPWHIYAQKLEGEGPVPTKITIKASPILIPGKDIKEVGMTVSKFEEVFSMNVKYYENEVDFVTIVKLKTMAKTVVTGTIQYMACTNEKCLVPQTIPFSIKL